MRMRAKENNGRLKENTEIRKGIVWHPGLDMFNTRVSACSTSGSRHVRHPGLGTFDTRVSDTRKRLTGLMTQEGNDTETCNEKKDRKKKWILCLKSISIHCFCAADQSSIFLNSTFHMFTLIIYLLPTLYTINSITLSISLDSFCTMEPSQSLTKLYLSLYTLLYNRKPKSALT